MRGLLPSEHESKPIWRVVTGARFDATNVELLNIADETKWFLVVIKIGYYLLKIKYKFDLLGASGH